MRRLPDAGPTGVSRAAYGGDVDEPSTTAIGGVREDDSDLGWIADLLTVRRADVMQRWVEAAARQPFHFGRRELAISNNLAQVYDAVVLLLETRPGTANAGTAGADPGALQAAEEHARDRIVHGLEPTDVVVEFRLLREETGRALMAHLPPGVAAVDAIRAILLMNSVFDGALMVMLGVLARHVDEARAAVLATATHDLAQPLTAIKGAIDMAGRVLGRSEPDLERVADAQRRALAGVDHAAVLLARLAAGARLALGAADLRRADMDLAEALRAAVARLGPEQAERDRRHRPGAVQRARGRRGSPGPHLGNVTGPGSGNDRARPAAAHRPGGDPGRDRGPAPVRSGLGGSAHDGDPPDAGDATS